MIVVHGGITGRVSDLKRGGAAEVDGGCPRDRRVRIVTVPELTALDRIRRRRGRTASAAKHAARRRGKPRVARWRVERGHAAREHERVIVLADVRVAVRPHAGLPGSRDEQAAASILTGPITIGAFMRKPALGIRAHG